MEEKEIAKFASVLKFFGIYEPLDKYKIVCPFHDDKNASMQINLSSAYFYCYGCQKSGSSVELVKEFIKSENEINDKEFKKLRRNYINTGNFSLLNINIFIEKLLKADNIIYNNIYNIYNIYKAKEKENLIFDAREYYNNLPAVNWYKASNNKGIEEEVLECKEYMNKRGFSNRILKKMGAKASLNKFYPILENGRFRGYIMRTFNKEIEEKRKYLYNRGFSRQKCLPGNFKNQNYIVCVEGYFDLIKANQLGINNCVAFLGWKASNKQLEKIKKANIKLIICALDNDDAGNRGYDYLKQIAKDYNFVVKRVKYPKGIKDMGDLRKGTEKAENVKKQIDSLFNSYLTNK